jgi:hypothetical protein
MNKIYQRLQNQYVRLQNQLKKVSFFNKLIIFSIVVLFSILFYLSIPALYDYERVQKQLKLQLLNEFNLNFNVSNKIQYKILPYPHFEIIDSVLYTDSKENQKLGDIKNLKIFISSLNLINQENIKLKNIKIVNSLFYLNQNSKKYLKDYFKKANFDKKIFIKKSKFFLKRKNEIISIFPIKNLILKYNKEKFENEIIINGKAFNSNFFFNSKKNFKDKSIDFTFELPKINLSIKNKLIPVDQKYIKFKSSNNINFIGTDIRSEFDIYDKYMDFSSSKSKIFNKKIDFSGKIEFRPFFLNSRIHLSQISLVKVLKNKNFFLELLNNENFIHNSLNAKILLNIDKFSKENIFNRANIFIEILNGEIKFDNSLFISDDFGNLELVNSVLYRSQKENFIRTNFIIDIKNQKKFYNIFQVPKNRRKNLSKINFIIERNITLGSTKILQVKINSIKNDNLQERLNDIFEKSDFSIKKKFDNWIALKRFFNLIITEINSV